MLRFNVNSGPRNVDLTRNESVLILAIIGDLSGVLDTTSDEVLK